MRIKLRKSEILRLFLFALFFGIFFGREPFFTHYILFFGCLFLVLAWIFRSWIWGVVSVFCFGLVWGQIQHHQVFQPTILESFYETSIDVVGTVKSFPAINGDTMSVQVEVESFKTKDQWFDRKSLGGIWLKTSVQSNIDYGDKIAFVGVLKKPRNFSTFNYQKYLKRLGASGIITQKKEVKILAKSAGGNVFARWAKKIRNAFSANLQNLLPKDHAQIAEGILLGVKNKLPKVIEQDFKNAGIQHILVVSGFNISILLIFVAFFLSRFGRRIVFMGSIVFLLFFVLMVGMEPSILRAAIFGGLSSVAVLMGRSTDSRNFLYCSAVFLGLYSPTMIQYDIGFFLSFSATFGIILGVPVFEKLPIPSKIRTPLAVIVSAQIAVLPILGLYFQQFPVVGFVSNFFVEPLVPMAMAFSFLAGMVHFISETGAMIFAMPAKVIIDGIFWVARIFGAYAPFDFSHSLSVVAAFLVWSFFIWGSFSRFFQQKFLEKNVATI